MDTGIVGGIIGSVLGFAGGAVGTYFSIKNTKGPLARAFMIKVAIVAWVAIIVFIMLVLVLPQPYNYLMWIPYGILLPLGIVKCNKQLAKLRQGESGT